MSLCAPIITYSSLGAKLCRRAAADGVYSFTFGSIALEASPSSR